MLTTNELYQLINNKIPGIEVPEPLPNETIHVYVVRAVQTRPEMRSLFLLNEELDCGNALNSCSKKDQEPGQKKQAETELLNRVHAISNKLKTALILQDQEGHFHAKLPMESILVPKTLSDKSTSVSTELGAFSKEIYLGVEASAESWSTKIRGLMDPVYTQFIIKAYDKALEGISNDEVRKKVRNALLMSMQWIAPNLEDFNRIFEKTLSVQGVEKTVADGIRTAFVDAMECEFKTLPEVDSRWFDASKLTIKPKFNACIGTEIQKLGVVILTCNSGNAHNIIAKTVNEKLAKDQVPAVIINESELYKDDILRQFTGVSYGQLYPVLEQQLALPEVRSEMKTIHKELLHYALAMNSVKLRQCIREIEDKKFSIGQFYVATHQTTALRCVPKTAEAIVQLCDFGPLNSYPPEISELAFEAGVVDAQRVKLLSPNPIKFLEKDLQEMMDPKAKSFLAETPKHLKNIVTCATYPVSKLTQAEDAEKYSKFCEENQYKESPDRIKCVLCVGGQGCAEAIHKYILAIQNDLRDHPTSKPIDLFVVCGRNETLLDDVKKKYESLSSDTGLLRIMPLGYVENEQYLALARHSVLISKPGGATVAECILNGISTLAIVDNEKFLWEKTNAEALESSELGIQYDQKVSIIAQIEKLDEKRKERDNINQTMPGIEEPKSRDVASVIKDELVRFKKSPAKSSRGEDEQDLSSSASVDDMESSRPSKFT